MYCYYFVLKSIILDIDVAIVFFKAYYLILYRMLHLKMKWHICGTHLFYKNVAKAIYKV
jgi:hypothetical protein